MAENETTTTVVETENLTENQQTEPNKANDPAAENHAEDPEIAKLKTELAKLKEVVRKVIPLLKDTPYVDELTKLVEEKQDAQNAQDFSAS